MNCIVVDDEEFARVIIAQMITLNQNLKLVGEFSNAMQAIKYLNHNPVDLIFLDVHMQGFSGFDFLNTIKNPPKTVLVTSDKQFALDAFEYDSIVDYIVKPISAKRFDKAVLKAISKISLNNKAVDVPLSQSDDRKDFYVNIDKRLVKIEFDSVQFVKAKGDYIDIIADDKVYTVHSTLKKITEKLPLSNFLKVHRSFIINTNKIIDFQDGSVLIGKNVIPVSRLNRAILIEKLDLL